MIDYIMNDLLLISYCDLISQVRPEEMNFSPLTSEERKDSLSVQVAFVKFHISRSRKLNFDKISLESSQNRWDCTA